MDNTRQFLKLLKKNFRERGLLKFISSALFFIYRNIILGGEYLIYCIFNKTFLRRISYKKWKSFFQRHEKEAWLKKSKNEGFPIEYHHISRDFFYDFLPSNFFTSKKTVVDLGCGPKGVIEYIDDNFKICIDSLALFYKEKFKLNEKSHFVAAVGEILPLKDESIDLVICTNTLDHMFYPHKAVQEIYRVLKKRGLFFVEVFLKEKDRYNHPFDFSLVYFKSLMGNFVTIKETIIKKDFSYPPRAIGLFRKGI